MQYFLNIFSLFFLTLSAISFAAENDLKSSYAKGEMISSPNNTYTILKRLGAGAFGEVFAVEDSQAQQFALKTYKNQKKLIEHCYTNAEREFLIGQKLNHPNIIKTFELFSSTLSTKKQVKNLLLELVQGEILMVTDKGSLPLEVAVDNIVHLCEALKYALFVGFMHVDLHPGNIMLKDDSSEIMIIDLASFATLEELIYDFTTNSSLKNSNAVNLFNPSTFSFPLSMVKPPVNKLDKFLKGNSEILRILRVQKEIFNTSMNGIANFNKSGPGVLTLFDEFIKKIMHNRISHQYFNDITDICITILGKASIDRKEKISLRGKIKKIAWEYEEDIEEDCNLELEEYIGKLINLMQKHKGNE